MTLPTLSPWRLTRSMRAMRRLAPDRGSAGPFFRPGQGTVGIDGLDAGPISPLRSDPCQVAQHALGDGAAATVAAVTRADERLPPATPDAVLASQAKSAGSGGRGPSGWRNRRNAILVVTERDGVPSPRGRRRGSDLVGLGPAVDSALPGSATTPPGSRPGWACGARLDDGAHARRGFPKLTT
jgi:hypothetical protein